MQNCGPNTCVSGGPNKLRPSMHQQSRQQGIDKSSSQQDLALACCIEQEGALTMISCGCGGALSTGGGQHDVKDCSSRYMAVLAEQEASTPFGSRLLSHNQAAGLPKRSSLCTWGCCAASTSMPTASSGFNTTTVMRPCLAWRPSRSCTEDTLLSDHHTTCS